MNNKVTGTRFEKAFASALAEQYFWVHLFQDNKNGQPCDVIAARGGHTYLFDCKDCQSDFFLLDRMEENQYNAMKLFEISGNGEGMFAIRYPDKKIYLVEYSRIRELQEAGFKRINASICRTQGILFEDWITDKNEKHEWGEGCADNNWK